MKEKDTSKSILTNSKSNTEDSIKDKYFNFFENAPIALYIEDFSKVQLAIENEAQKHNLTVENFLIKYPKFSENLHSLVIIKEVNATAVKLYKATSKNDLLENLEKVFTTDSTKGFSKLVFDLLCGRKEPEVETINKTFLGEKIHVLIKYNVENCSKNALDNVIVSVENITNLVQAKKALLKSEQRYKESQTIAKIASWSYDFEEQEINWSDEVYKMVGIEKNNTQLSLDFYLSFIHKEDIDLVHNFSINYLLQHPFQELNYRIYTKKGELKHVYERRNTIIVNNKIQRIIGICQDVTDQVVSKKKLNATKQLLSNTLSSIQDGFVILDNNSKYLYVNQVAAQLLGKKEHELIGKHLWTEFPEKEGDLFYDQYQNAFKTKRTISFENYFAPWNRWFENRIIPSNNTMLIFFHETTDKKENENKIKAAYNIINKSSSVAVLVKNVWDFPIVFASENSIKLFGYTSSELLSQVIKIHEMVHPNDIEYIRTHFFKLLKGEIEEGQKPKAFRIITKKGKIKWIETSIDIIRNSNNEITHIQGIAEDVTERKKTEDLFFKSNQRLQDQFNNTPLASIIWDLDFKVIDWNNAAHKIFGYSAQEAKGKHAKDLIIPKNILNDINAIWHELLSQKGGYRNKNENVTKNGDTIICDWYNVTLKDVEGNVIGVASLVDDITERNKSKILLEKSEKKYRDIFEKSIDPVLILEDGTFVDCNKATLQMFGYSKKEELLSIHPSKISPEKQPDGQHSFEKAEKMMQIALEKGSNRFRWYHQQKNGHVFPAEVTLTRIDEDDFTVRIHAVVKDITERVKKEVTESVLYNISRAALTIDDFNEFGFFIKSELNNIIDTSNFYIALYNKETDTFQTPVMVDQMESTNEFPAKKTLTGYVVKTKKTLILTQEQHANLIQSGEVELFGVDSKIWVGIPLISQNQVFGAIVIQSYTNEKAYSKNDIQLLEFVASQISTAIQRKNADNELKKALIKAQESDRLKSAFLANMSHEIRTPMNGIIGFSELFLEENLSYKERIEYAQIVINSSKQLLSIVNDILDISKIEAGVVKLHYQRVNINQLLNELEIFYKPIASENNLQLICKKGLENKDSNIEIDKTKLNQVIANLLSNSFKFTQKGFVEFGYELINNQLQFYVKDTGIGIEENLQDKIFDRFIQADTNFETQTKGTGLGLAISKKFIELLQGEIWLSSSSNGTTIYFTIPYKKIEETIQTAFVENKQKSESTKNKPITILVAEDEVYNLLYINELFSKTNYKIIEAHNGQEAIDYVKSNPNIQLILMDIKMPVMNGNAAMKEIKKTHPTIPIIALSAFAMESDKENALASGFNSYLSKPIDKKLLFELIEEFVK